MDKKPFELDVEATVKASEKMSEEFFSVAGETTTALFSAMSQGIMPKDILGLEPEKVEALYGQAYGLYNAGKYAEAKSIFKVLTMMDTFDSRFSFGLASCLHMEKDYMMAAVTYSIAAEQDKTNPMPTFHGADCQLQIGGKQDAYKCLKETIHRCSGRKEFAIVKEKAKIVLEGLRHEFVEKKKNKKKKKK